MSRGTLSSSGSLYVGDLHVDATESTLFEVFRDLGPIISIRVCRDSVARVSLGYAYVNFQNPIDAERAIETQNHTLVKGKPIRIMWSQRDPGIRKSGVGNVFVKNVDPTVTNQVLYDTFSACGNILSCKIVTDEETGVSKGYGFVHFENDEGSRKAVETLNGTVISGQKIFVGPFIKRSQRMSGLLTNFTNVYIKEMVDLDAEELKEKFSTFGEVTSACTKKEPRLERAFGFVNFAKHDDAVKAINELHGKFVEGLSTEGSSGLYVQRAMKRAERDQEIRRRFLAEKAKRQFPAANNLYVKNLEDTVGEAELRKMFESFGEITSSVIMKDHTAKQSKGFGFVCFKDAEMAQKALADMNGKLFGSKPLYVNVAQKKDARRSMLEMQYAQRRSMPPQAFMGAQTYYNPMYYAPMPQYYGKGGMPPYGGRGGKGMRGGGMPRPGYSRGGGVHPGSMKPKVHVQRQAAAEPAADTGSLTAETLAAMSPGEQKNALGEQLYHKIAKSHPDQVAKITGMLLEMDVSETLNLLESPQVLESKIQEALSVLNQLNSK
eukprot:TRINITY_DN1017_c1_g1_i1.p1 TRINITY_DN1017_c1_g1~~TRINITY_DN1017_c1_g1_i1.p1  ORF type:complete len:549 (+),score=121.20 TRINITY_DN1017_c1_g1_i1:74-1720(+)